MVAGGDLTVSLTDGSLATLEGIQLQLAANLVGQNVQISGIDATSINNITLQVGCSQFNAFNFIELLWGLKGVWGDNIILEQSPGWTLKNCCTENLYF